MTSSEIEIAARPARIAVLASGNGSNLQALIDAAESGQIAGRIVAVVCNRQQAYALERARLHGIAVECLTLRSVKGEGGTREDFDVRLAHLVACYEPDLIVLAGFMHILSRAFLDRFEATAVINLHPSLLPANPADDAVALDDGTTCRVFRGHDAVQQALEAKVRRTGSSVHFVTADVDRGPVLAQVTVPVDEHDTAESLQQRIQQAEHLLLPQAVGKLLEERGFSVPVCE